MKHGKEEEKYVVVKQILIMEGVLGRQRGCVMSACLVS